MFFKGMSFGFMARNGYYSSAEGKAETQRVIASGATAVALMVNIMQDTFASTRVYRDFILTPSDDEVRDAIRTFRQAGLKVMLKPILNIWDSTHRGDVAFPEPLEMIAGIKTDYWGEWFKNYTAAIVHYARLCELEGAEMLCVGCEMTGEEKQEKYWFPLIEAVRKVYHGLVSYNTPCWWHYDVRQNWIRGWFSELDMIGISNYYGNAHGDLGMQIDVFDEDHIAQGFMKQRRFLDEAYDILKKPIFFAECGVRSVRGAVETPSDCWENQNGFDGQIQCDYMGGFTRAYWDAPWWAGFFWWKWDEQQDRPYFHHATGDTGCTIAGKPAEKFFHDLKVPVR